MRILLLSNLYPPYVAGGAEILAGDVAHGLESLGHEVIVLTSYYGLPHAQQQGNTWRTLRISPSAHFDRGRVAWQQLSLLFNYYRDYHNEANAKELRRVIEATQPDILYIWEITGLGINSLLAALPDLQVPVVFHLGSYWWQYTRSPQTEQSRLNLRRFKQLLIGNVPSLTYSSLIAVSSAVKHKYIESGCDADRIEVIYNGVDTRFLDQPRTADADESSLAKDGCDLIYAGRLCDEKGVLVLLKAFDILVHELHRSHLHLNIFGDGDPAYVGELQAFVREKELAEFVTLHGKVPQDHLIQFYDRSDIMLVPSLWQEPFGLVVAEAMARGVPVIASNVGGPAEIITHGVDGLLVEPGEERVLASTIHSLIENPDERQRLSRAARARVHERFSMRENTRRVEQHLVRLFPEKLRELTPQAIS